MFLRKIPAKYKCQGKTCSHTHLGTDPLTPTLPLGSFLPAAGSFEDSIVSSDIPTMIQWEFIALGSTFADRRISHQLVNTWNKK